MEFFNMKLIFAERLSALRKDRYRTQENFADAMGVSTASIKKWECGEVIPEMKHLFKICELLHCDMDYLIGRIDFGTHAAITSSEYTGLSEKAIGTLHEWENSHDQRKYWSTVVSMMIEDPRFSDVMRDICSAQYAFRNLSPSDSSNNVMMTDGESTILALAWYISKKFSDITDDIISIKYDVD